MGGKGVVMQLVTPQPLLSEWYSIVLGWEMVVCERRGCAEYV